MAKKLIDEDFKWAADTASVYPADWVRRIAIGARDLDEAEVFIFRRLLGRGKSFDDGCMWAGVKRGIYVERHFRKGIVPYRYVAERIRGT